MEKNVIISKNLTTRCCIMMEMVKNEIVKKRKDLSLQEKLQILECYDQLPKMSQRSAAAHLKISQPLLCKILKNRSGIEKSALSSANIDRKRVRSGKDSDVESALKIWFGSISANNIPINSALIRQKAEEFAKELGKENFTATDGWISRWKKRENIVYGRSPDKNERITSFVPSENWIRTEWPKMITGYSLENIYKADETGLYFRAIPEHNYLFKNRTDKDLKFLNERVTILCCANMKGQKRELLVIGKSTNLRSLKEVRNLPVSFCSNETAVMTTVIFNNWLLEWDSELTQNIILLVDSRMAHSSDLPLNHINLVFMPADATLLAQPHDHSVIQALKAYYRREIYTRILAEINEMQGQSDANEIARQIPLLDALHLLAIAWKQISLKTIGNFFKIAGLSKKNAASPSSKEVEIVLNAVLDQSSNMTKEEFDYWLAVDDEIEVAAAAMVLGKCESVANVDPKLENDNQLDAEDEICESPPSSAQMREALKILRRGVQYRSADFQKHYEYEQFINELLDAENLQLTF